MQSNISNDNNNYISGGSVEDETPKEYECHNCHRKGLADSIEESSFYDIKFVTRQSDNIVRRRQFKHVAYQSSHPRTYTFCMECDFYLDPEKSSHNNDFYHVVWCSFFWSLLSNREIHINYGQRILKFVPMEWRPWWLDSLSSTFPNIFTDISLDRPCPVFEDKTIDIKEWNDDINSYLLSRLASTSNKFLRPTIKCSWGCSEFHHKVGHLPLDIVFQRILQQYSIKMFTKSNLGLEKNVISIREDYIRDDNDEKDYLFFNREWKIVPSLAFVNGKGPLILTCNEHNGGTKLFMVHPCRWQHNLPARKPDQLCQAVMQPRILRPMKASKYSTSFQMFNQTGTFNGIDTCSATSYGNFDFISKLTAEAEARSIFNRSDINAHLSKLREENVISEYVESGRRDFATRFSRSKDYSRFVKGGTYVSLEASISLQNENRCRSIKALLDHRAGTIPVRLNFNKYWSEYLYL